MEFDMISPSPLPAGTEGCGKTFHQWSKHQSTTYLPPNPGSITTCFRSKLLLPVSIHSFYPRWRCPCGTYLCDVGKCAHPNWRRGAADDWRIVPASGNNKQMHHDIAVQLLRPKVLKCFAIGGVRLYFHLGTRLITWRPGDESRKRCPTSGNTMSEPVVQMAAGPALEG